MQGDGGEATLLRTEVGTATDYIPVNHIVMFG